VVIPIVHSRWHLKPQDDGKAAAGNLFRSAAAAISLIFLAPVKRIVVSKVNEKRPVGFQTIRRPFSGW
jgi:hypothetical protein